MFMNGVVTKVPYQHIAILRLSAIGDVVLTVPMIRALQNAYPNTKLTWIIGKAAYSLLEGLSGVDFIVVDKPSSLLDYYAFWQKIKNYHFDVLIAMQASFRANLMYPLISAKRKVGFDKARAKDLHRWFVSESINAQNNHLLDGFMSFALYLGAKKPDRPQWQLPLALKERQWQKQFCDLPYIVINPAASKLERNWPIERYIELITRIQFHYPKLKIIISGSRDDLDFVQPILDKTSVSSLVGKTSLKELAVLLEGAVCLIAPDTGSVHISTAVNTPVLGLYAVITSKLSGPYLSSVFTIDKYKQAVLSCLKQQPDSVKWGVRVHSLEAMKLITVDEVFETFHQIIK